MFSKTFMGDRNLEYEQWEIHLISEMATKSSWRDNNIGRNVLKVLSSEMWRHVTIIRTDVSEELVASIIKVEKNPRAGKN
jgi:hypothetical protein